MRTLAEVIQAARDSAAASWGVAAAEIEVEQAEALTWPDGSLGCPQPGRMYTQALVPGYRIRVRHGPRVQLFHADRRGALVPCDPARTTPPAAGTEAWR